jgi:hypothetical protein
MFIEHPIVALPKKEMHLLHPPLNTKKYKSLLKAKIMKDMKMKEITKHLKKKLKRNSLMFLLNINHMRKFNEEPSQVLILEESYSSIHEEKTLVKHNSPQISKHSYTSIEEFEDELHSNLFASTPNKDMGIHECILNDMHFQNFNSNLDRSYWEFLGDRVIPQF